MCKHGQTEDVRVLVPADLAHEEVATWKVKPIDKCIASIVRALNIEGVYTRGSCCGHGEDIGQIILQDGRVIYLTKIKS